MNWPLLQNSLWLSGVTTALAVGLGYFAALWLAALDRRWRNRLLLGAVIALVLPPFLVSNCWLDLLGATGKWRAWLPVNLYSIGGAAAILILLYWPITTLLVVGAWHQLEASQLEADPALRGAGLIRWLLWPTSRAAAGQAAVLTFVLALNNFTVPAILQVKVFPAEVWLRFSTNLRPVEALAVGWPLVAAPILLLLLLRRAEISWPRGEGPATAQAVRRQLGAAWFAASGAVTAGLLVLSVGLPLGQVVSGAPTWREVPNVLRAAPAVIGHSALFAAGAASLCVVAGLLGWRLRVGTILWLPFLVPGVFTGIALIYVFNREPWSPLYRSAAVVVLAFAVRYLALGWNGVTHALRTADPDLADAARLDGAGGWALFRHVHWPQIAPQAGAAWYLTYLLCLWDVETLLLICPPGGETLALRVFNLLHYGHHAQVNALCLLLLGLAVAPLVLAGIGQRLAGRPNGQ